MKTVKGATLLSIVLLLSSCWTARFPTHGDKTTLTKADLNLINGTYKNSKDTGRRISYLWPLLNKERNAGSLLTPDDTCKNCLVTIKATTANIFTASLVSPEQQPLKTIQLKYRLRRGCIKTRTHYQIKCQYGIFWAFYSHADQLTLNKEQQLIVDSHPCSFAFAVFMMDGLNGENNNNTFSKIYQR